MPTHRRSSWRRPVPRTRRQDTLTSGSSDKERAVTPVLLVGKLGYRGLEKSKNGTELAVIDADQENAAGMLSALFSQFAQNLREVLDVEGHHDPFFLGGELPEGDVIESLQFPVLINSEDVVAPFAQAPAYGTP